MAQDAGSILPGAAVAQVASASGAMGPGELDETVGEKVRINVPAIGKLTYQQLFQMTSNQGETLDAFLLRVGPKLRAYSDATGFEACGEIAHKDGRFGIVAGTSFSHLACAIFKNKVPAGMEPIGAGIHSHGGKHPFKQTREDRVFSGIGDDPRAIVSAIVYGQELDMFSQQDMALGRGYLAIPGGVLLNEPNRGVSRLVASAQ